MQDKQAEVLLAGTNGISIQYATSSGKYSSASTLAPIFQSNNIAFGDFTGEGRYVFESKSLIKTKLLSELIFSQW
jgi:hypothetical protein